MNKKELDITATDCNPSGTITISGGGEVSEGSNRLPPELQLIGNEHIGVPAPIFDHLELLRKYMLWVTLCEARGELTCITTYKINEIFSDLEWEEIRRIRNMNW